MENKEAAGYYKKILGWCFPLVLLFPLVLSFFDLPSTIAIIVFVAFSISWKTAEWSGLSAPIKHEFFKNRKSLSNNQKPMGVPIKPISIGGTFSEKEITVREKFNTEQEFNKKEEANIQKLNKEVNKELNVEDSLDHFIIVGFNAYQDNNLAAAANAFYVVWQKTEDPDLIGLVANHLIRIYRDLGDYNWAILIGYRTIEKLTQLSAPTFYREQLKKEVSSLRRLYIILSANGIGHLPYNSAPDYIKKMADYI